MSDDLAGALPDPSRQPMQPMGYRQGTILSWDPVTLENTVEAGGAVLPNLPVQGISDAVTYQPGTTVSLMVVESTWAIVGTFVRPGTAAAAQAVSMLSARTKAQTINVQESTTSFAWTDLATPGPAVTITIGPSGRALMWLSAKGGWSLVVADVYQGAFMTAQLSGANTLAADLQWAAFIETQHGSTTFATVSTTIGSAYTFEGLTPGETTFTVKYSVGASGRSVDFNRRTLVVIAL